MIPMMNFSLTFTREWRTFGRGQSKTAYPVPSITMIDLRQEENNPGPKMRLAKKGSHSLLLWQEDIALLVYSDQVGISYIFHGLSMSSGAGLASSGFSK
jgi:hypothetical protein